MPPRPLKKTFAAAALLALWGAGCGANPKPVTNLSALTPAEERLFEHGVDFIGRLEGLEGRWRTDWDQELQGRVGSSNLIAIVTVRTLRTDTDPEQRVTHRVVCYVERVISGDDPHQELEFAVREGTPGFASVDESLHRLQGNQFVAFVKWYQNEAGEPVPHWHMSPASEQVVAETEGYVARKNPSTTPGERVIVHTN